MNKLIDNNATVQKADKGNTIVVMYNSDYQLKVEDFINSSRATEKGKNINKTFQKKLRHNKQLPTVNRQKHKMETCKHET
jgi:hypothetical protein